jgi:hypothetical protein
MQTQISREKTIEEKKISSIEKIKMTNTNRIAEITKIISTIRIK